jgi:flagellar basal-body rod modification protein FlgD
MQVGSVTSNPYVVPDAPKKKSDLSMETFMRLLTVQLSTQNPLEPMNDRDFFAQIAQLGQVQGVDKLTKQSQVEQAQSMMGKEVVALRPNQVSNPSESPVVTGIVRRLSIVNGEYKISIEEPRGGMVEVGLDAVQSINKAVSPNEYAYLIGKNVTGFQSNAAIAGKVIGVRAEGGTIIAEVTDNAGKRVGLAVDRINSIGE